MTIPFSGFTFPNVEQQKAHNISATISFPDDLVQTEDGGNKQFCIHTSLFTPNIEHHRHDSQCVTTSFTAK